ncbi:uncharacterized protein H6S33_007214 [Morchella sextelata]|uniref:uncharacterized protein n=1 Tax=Morchella sextelata TaxID=1174677 RepID=UPI001D059205|nr:uncharacterized protein H6S33_007214 [Morchella sextelata]KAH0604183.1 hypothetical protein H6S33_007214 [Morchella sextelata]
MSPTFNLILFNLVSPQPLLLNLSLVAAKPPSSTDMPRTVSPRLFYRSKNGDVERRIVTENAENAENAGNVETRRRLVTESAENAENAENDEDAENDENAAERAGRDGNPHATVNSAQRKRQRTEKRQVISVDSDADPIDSRLRQHYFRHATAVEKESRRVHRRVDDFDKRLNSLERRFRESMESPREGKEVRSATTINRKCKYYRLAIERAKGKHLK